MHGVGLATGAHAVNLAGISGAGIRVGIIDTGAFTGHIVLISGCCGLMHA